MGSSRSRSFKDKSFILLLILISVFLCPPRLTISKNPWNHTPNHLDPLELVMTRPAGSSSTSSPALSVRCNLVQKPNGFYKQQCHCLPACIARHWITSAFTQVKHSPLDCCSDQDLKTRLEQDWKDNPVASVYRHEAVIWGSIQMLFHTSLELQLETLTLDRLSINCR